MAADPRLELDERLREASSIGDPESVRQLLGRGARVNGQNPVNGWTCLHWACKRGHSQIVSCLLDAGADKDILTNKGESAAQLTMKPEIRAMLGVNEDSEPVVNGESQLTFLPNYLANPPFPYKENQEANSTQAPATGSPTGPKPSLTQPAQNGAPAGPPATFQPLFFTGTFPVNERELILKVRIQNPAIRDNDFIEVDLDRRELTYQALLSVSCQELNVHPEQVEKIRKLPNTLLRKDKEVARLQNFQELEFVLLKSDTNTSSSPAALTERPCYNQGAATLTY
ncbi:ankyrin repeat domain-containing protein 40 isoform X1 [Carcharodon carcharias]|uniref:ankyrin repeat domain-containing protein 40 isoform X1 n=1 Tax=Carcharodon carcharias TaxID=13397 RepID=UPI001B7F4F90|nr:ankyrin repeat domain-containing protein 40 isoform X1 [Carcharodon carcharias]